MNKLRLIIPVFILSLSFFFILSDKVNALSLNFYESFFYKYTYKIGDNFTRFGNSINTINFGNLKKQETISRSNFFPE